MKKNLAIDPVKNVESYNYVNCFEKPMGMILGNEQEGYQIDFFLVLKLLQCYLMECFDNESIFYTVEYNDALAYIFEDMLHMDMLIKKTDKAGLSQIIKETIDQGRFALVPGNLRFYPDSEYFDENDWKHLFLITGYDEEKQEFAVCDNTHEEDNDGSIYLAGTLDYFFVEKLFDEAVVSFGISSVWSIDVDKKAGYSGERHLKDVLDLYLFNRCEQPYKEIACIRMVQDKIRRGERLAVNVEGEEILKSMEFIFLRTIRYKEFFYKELSAKLRLMNFDGTIIKRIDSLSKDIAKQWQGIANSVLINYHLMQEFDMEDRVLKAVMKEKEMCHLLTRIKKELGG